MSVFLNLENRHIMIAGASSGIGRATAILASQLGARVSLIARREAELKETLSRLEGEGHSCWPFDLLRFEEIGPKVKEIVAAMGPLDGLAHCVGIAQNRPLVVADPDYVHHVMDVNFNTFVELLRVVAKKKHINDGAGIVALSSVAAVKGNKSQGAYAASKAALSGLVPPLAKELAARRIRLNAVAFGMINTDMYTVFKENGGHVEALEAEQYLGVGEPEDAAKVLCFLLSDYARFITGTTLVADGGFLS